MKRYYLDNGDVNPQTVDDLEAASKLIHKAFDIFLGAGYNPRDFLQFVSHEGHSYLYDWTVMKALKEAFEQDISNE